MLSDFAPLQPHVVERLEGAVFGQIPSSELERVRLSNINRLRFSTPIERLFRDYYDARARLWLRLVALLVACGFGLWLVALLIEPRMSFVPASTALSLAMLTTVIAFAGLTYALTLTRAPVRSIQYLLVVVFVPFTIATGALRISNGDLAGGQIALFLSQLLLPLFARLRARASLLPIVALLAAAALLPWRALNTLDLPLLIDGLMSSLSALALLYLLERDARRDFYQRALIYQLAVSDPMTGTFNRRSFLEHVARELERAQRYGGALALLLLDIDHFKNVNDTYGHATGDAALYTLVRVCAATLRQSDLIGRMGGEEFAVLLPETDLTTAVAVAERLRARLAETPISAGEASFSCTVSIGVAAPQPGDRAPDALLARADARMYQAKQRGRNMVVGD
jgi:diguanylate cyclase (GGDEF)-like protein